MNDAEKRHVLVEIEKCLDWLKPKPNDINNFIVRFEGRKLKQVDLDRHLSRPD